MSIDNNASAHARQGETYRMMGIRDQVKDPKEVFMDALNEFSKAIEELKGKDADLAWAHAHRGATYFQLGLLGDTFKYQEAIKDFDFAIGLKDDYGWAYAQKGETYRWIGISNFLEPTPVDYFEKSVAAFDKAIELTSDYAWAYAHRGAAQRFLFPKPPIKAAIDDLSKAVEINPDYAWAYAYLAVFHRMAKDFENAYNDLEEAARLYPDVFDDPLEIELPDYKVPSHIMGFTGFSLEQLEEAKRQLESTKQSNTEPNPFAVYLVALDKFLKGGFSAAANELETGRNLGIL